MSFFLPHLRFVRHSTKFVLVASILAAQAHGADTEPNPRKTWQQYGGGPDQSKYLELDQITKANVKQLEIAWTYPAGSAAYMFNPIVIDDVMYALGKDDSLVALDASTGKEIWVRANLSGITRTGINYWESKDRKDRRLIYTRGNLLEAIDATTGKSIVEFGDRGATSLKEGLGRDPATINRVQSTTPGQIFENLIFLGSSPGEAYFSAPGHVRAYDVVTGKLVWTFHTIPQPGEFGYETWPKDAHKYVGGVNAWGEITVDTKNGIVFFPLGSPTYDYYGADREGDNLFSDCLLALDARTGKRLWHFQAVHHDLWDYDFCSAAQLVTVQHEGKTVEAVAIAGKQGFLYVFDRHTGKPLWPIEERPVPQSTMPGEKTSPTQPFPTVVPPFTRHDVTVDTINPYLPADKREPLVKRVAAAKTGIYQPPSDQYETVVMPGAVGGANRGNTAADPDRGLVYVITQDLPSFYKLKPELPLWSDTPGTEPKAPEAEPEVKADDQLARGKAAYAANCQACHGAELEGRAAVPTLVGAAKRIGFNNFTTVVGVGRGVMPGFPHLQESAVADLFSYLGGNAAEATSGPGQRRRNPFAVPKRYPPGIMGPAQNYSTGYGTEVPNLLTPPWSSIVAYDLNKGTIKWRKPLGHDPKVPLVDGQKLGLGTGSQRKGMIVTSTGLIFSTCLDGNVYAFDAENGDELWSSPLPRNPEGLPAMYEARGRQYLVICNMGQVIDRDRAQAIPSGYIVYALPEKSPTK
jgi:quinoprotein glucose dehydrogenase